MESLSELAPSLLVIQIQISVSKQDRNAKVISNDLAICTLAQTYFVNCTVAKWHLIT